MRIAVSGSHRTGKSTLVAALSRRLPAYSVADEPYHLMEEEGYEFAHPPSLEDFEAQLARSVAETQRPDGDVLFDRCPMDFLAYLALHDDRGAFDDDAWRPGVREAMRTLDLVVFTPVESPDRIADTLAHDDGTWRRAVDEHLRALLLDDAHDLGVDVIEATGEPDRRVRVVLEHLGPSDEDASRN